LFKSRQDATVAAVPLFTPSPFGAHLKKFLIEIICRYSKTFLPDKDNHGKEF
jgi:hypothetical protein